MALLRLPPTIPGLLTGVRPVPILGQPSTFETIRTKRPSTTVGQPEITNDHNYTSFILPRDTQPQFTIPTTTEVSTTATSTFTLTTHVILPRVAQPPLTHPITIEATMDNHYISIVLPRAAQPQLKYPTTTEATTTATATSTTTSISTLTTGSVTETATSTTTSVATSTATATATYYPPASSHFALSIPVITGIVVAGVGFLVLLAIIAAFTVCFLDRKKETKAQRQERKLAEQEKKRLSGSSAGGTGTATENSSVVGDGRGTEDGRWDANGTASGSVIGSRYASMIGVNTDNTQSSNAAGPSTPDQEHRERERGRARERTIIHLPVHVSDLGTPRQTQSQMDVQYERVDPEDAERDERGFRRGASWWHPEL